MDNTSSNLATNIRQLRSARQLSQAQLAQIAGIPRPTLAHLESGSANPTLSVMMRLASALQVLIEELVAPPRDLVRHFSAGELRQRQRGTVSVRQILPEPIRGLSVERVEFPAGAHEAFLSHARGTHKYLSCECGTITLSTDGETVTLRSGDVAVFRGDQPHSCQNEGMEVAVCYGVVTSAPIPG